MGNCGHPCEARPCGDAECRPMRERFTCRCHPGMPHPCPAIVGSQEHLPVPRRQQQQQEQEHQQQQQQGTQQQRHIDASLSSTTGLNTIATTSVGNPEQGFILANHHRIPIQYQSKVGVPSFTGSDSYLHYNDADTMKRFALFLSPSLSPLTNFFIQRR